MTSFSIPILLEENAGIGRNCEPVRIGVPIPRGAIMDAGLLRLNDPEGKSIPLQARPLANWPDRSLKWVIIDFLASVRAGSRSSFLLFSSDTRLRLKAVSLKESESGFVINTGAAVFTIPRNRFAFFSSVRVAETEVLTEDGARVTLMDLKGNWHAELQKLEIEEAGPLRVVLLAEGWFKSLGRKLIVRFSSRTNFFAGRSLVQIDFQVHNPRAAIHPGGFWDLGDPGSIHFKDLSIRLALRQNRPEPVVKYSLNEDTVPCQPYAPSTFLNEPSSNSTDTIDAIDTLAPPTSKHSANLTGFPASKPHNLKPMSLVIYQDSSGGENWDSTNHIDRNGALTVSFRGFRVTTGREGEQKVIKEGFRASPVVEISDGSVWAAAAIEGFWQNFPKALRVHAHAMCILPSEPFHSSLITSQPSKLKCESKLGEPETADSIDPINYGNSITLDLALFPGECRPGFELQGGEKKRHTIFLEFGQLQNRTHLDSMLRPLEMSLDTDCIQRSLAVPYFTAVKTGGNNDDKGHFYIHNVIEGPDSFFAKREIIDEYGWRNFGDIYADHEAVNFKGPGRLVSHYNNQYDFIFGGIVHFLRCGDRRWWGLARDLARHVADIDIYHTDEDKPAYNHGLFWHTDHYKDAGTATHRSFSRQNSAKGSCGGGPSNENNYTSGLLLYYYITGEAEAREAIVELANWVLGMDDGSRSLFGVIDEGPTGLASSTASTDYHKPGRGAGNSINALCDAYRLTGLRKYLSKAEELIQRCIHPADDLTPLKLVADPERRWSYLVFLQILGKYLDLKIDFGEIDYNMYYARDSLLHYANWMAANEKPYQELLSIVEIPSETWPAHDIRKCNIFHLAAQYGSPVNRSQFNERAKFFYNCCLKDLLSWKTAYLARPLVILTVYFTTHDYFLNKKFYSENFVDHSYNFGPPQAFTPQRARLLTSMRFKVRQTVRLLNRIIDEKSRLLRK